MTQADTSPHWWDFIKCRGIDIERFIISRQNKGRMRAEVLALCDRCPVRVECRDDMLAVLPRGPASIIAGGWLWYRDGRAKPHRDDLLLARELIATAKHNRYRMTVRT